MIDYFSGVDTNIFAGGVRGTSWCFAIEGGGAKSYDDRGLWCYQLYNDGGRWSYKCMMMEVGGATKNTLSNTIGLENFTNMKSL